LLEIRHAVWRDLVLHANKRIFGKSFREFFASGVALLEAFDAVHVAKRKKMQKSDHGMNEAELC
jgi:hypothetical protein